MSKVMGLVFSEISNIEVLQEMLKLAEQEGNTEKAEAIKAEIEKRKE